MEHQDRYEAIFRLALEHAKAVAKAAVGGDSTGIKAALAYVGMVASEYSQITGKERDVRYTLYQGDRGARLLLEDTSAISRPFRLGEGLSASGFCRQVYEESPLHELFQQNGEMENTQEDGPCLRL